MMINIMKKIKTNIIDITGEDFNHSYEYRIQFLSLILTGHDPSRIQDQFLPLTIIAVDSSRFIIPND